MAKRRSLGRGLEVLLSTASARAASVADGADDAPAPEERRDADVPARTEDTLRELPIDLLQRGKYQPRIDMREETLAELAESIRAQGIVQPIVVRPLQGGTPGEVRYEIIAGERRWRAAQMAGLEVVPAVVRDIPDEAAVAVALIENIQRENLNPLEEARSLKRLIDEFGMTHAQAAEAVGRSRVTVSNLLRLLELPEAVRAMLERRELDMGHARALLGVPSAAVQLELANRIRKEGWSVRDTEKAIRKLAGRSEPRPVENAAAKDPNVRRLEVELSERLGAAVSIEHGRTGGRVVIRYHSLDELDGIIAHIR
ncbi:MAG TPA: ParB/RepB/Spo0J family partition protein [Gammaproteobacteria bacterium]